MRPCPACQRDLIQDDTADGGFGACPDGHGRYLQLDALRRSAPPEVFQELWNRVRQQPPRTAAPCVGCDHPMAPIQLPGSVETILVCPDCRLAWCSTAAWKALLQSASAPQPTPVVTPLPPADASPLPLSGPPKVCPSCGQTLLKDRSAEGMFWACPDGHGWLLSMVYLRQKVALDAVKFLWTQVRDTTERKGRACPTCRKPMAATHWERCDEAAELCPLCQTGWFTAGILQALPPAPPPPKVVNEDEKIPASIRQMLAIEQTKKIAEKYADHSTAGSPDHWWQYLLGLLGMPIRLGRGKDLPTPWATYGLVAALSVMTAICLNLFGHPKEAAEAFGLVPGDPLRAGGLGLVTNFFVHPGLGALLGNLYLMLLVSSQVENDLGYKRYLGLVGLSLLAADLLEILFHPAPTVPRIGAAGGVAGLLAFFSFRFPGARFGFLIPIRMTFLKLPAIAFIILWFLYKSIRSGDISETFTDPWALLGGGLAGFVAWWFWGRKRKEEESFT